MAKTGPKPKRADGWHITKSGYLRKNVEGRLVLQHVYKWEKENGKIPKGYSLHHIDGDKLNNDISNLQLVTPTEHKRIHSGCELRGDEWWKPCGICKELKPINEENWYISPEGWPLYGRCRPCHIGKVVQDKRLRRLRKQNKD